jgi:hypothetical protein
LPQFAIVEAPAVWQWALRRLPGIPRGPIGVIGVLVRWRRGPMCRSIMVLMSVPFATVAFGDRAEQAMAAAWVHI